MKNRHNFVSLAIALLFVLILQKFASPQPVFRFLVPAFAGLLAVVWFYNRWYLRQMEKYNFWIQLRPLLLLSAGFGIFSVLPSELWREIFLVASVPVITLFELVLGNLTENLILNETLFIAFGLFSYFFASYFYAPAYQPYYALGVFISSSLLARCFYEFLPQDDKVKIVSSLVLGLFCAELFWVMNFLPFHFSFLAFLMFNLFYFCLIINNYYLFHSLSAKKIQFHLSLLMVCMFLALLATPWVIMRQ